MPHTRIARLTGAAYLGLAITGMLGFLWLRPQIVADDAATALSHLTEDAGTAHVLVVLELGIVLTQALAAIGFLALWRRDAPVSGAAIAAYGLLNAAAIMTSAAAMATANAVAADPGLAPSGDAAGTVQLLFEISDHAWGVGAVFFGLWLIPMGWAILATRRMPVALGWLLVVGGAGYVASALVGYGWADAPSALVEGLTFPATAGELWMIAYLLTVGIRRAHKAAVAAPAPAPSTAARS
ncbi:DUF4386 domain-containing protein [Demequina mangrovi]|uniref:DUF4386 domain-containing protein n=1 Tax=Demequina mangrovi TaxID=1043493 RepID=A0A1H6VAJ0_9MICO|nr:DUF4386 domain-containing protein [Demequina mangrovi]SEI99974.1 protein of unknown function [Demequina mangrovi]